jgi:lipopolysaccharide transport system ATP-binding protein
VFAVGDLAFKNRCMERFQTLKAAGHTIVLVSHGPPHIEQLCDRALLLDGGRAVAVDTGKEIARRYVETNRTDPVTPPAAP